MAIKDWSTTASNNATADSDEGIIVSEGQAPSSLNDTIRALMAVIKGDFANSLATPGYQKFPNGLILQWGPISGTGGGSTTFPVAFPTTWLSVVGQSSVESPSFVGALDIFARSAIGFSWRKWSSPAGGGAWGAGSETAYFIAVGC